MAAGQLGVMRLGSPVPAAARRLLEDGALPRDTVLTTLAALEQLLRRGGVTVPVGGGVDAALDAYGSAE